MAETRDDNPAGQQRANPSPPSDPLVEALVYVARAQGRIASREGLMAGLPLEDGRLTPSLLVRAAQRAGLDSTLVERRITDLTGDMLPAILLLADGDACVVTAQEGQTVTLASETGSTKCVPLDDIEARYTGTAFLTRPTFDFDSRTPKFHQRIRGHWFISAMLRHLPLYRDVMIAAATINVFALGLPLFTRTVYDRVVPNHALDTLWVLAAGLALVLCAELVLRTMRSYFLDLANRRIDIDTSSFIMTQVLGMRLEQRPPSVGSFAANLRSFETVRNFVSSTTLTALIDLPFTLLFLIVIGFIAWPLLIPLLVGMAIVFSYAATTGPRMHEIAESSYRGAALRNATLIESLTGLETVKAIGAEGVMQKRWEQSEAFLAARGAQQRLLGQSTLHVAMTTQQFVSISVIIIGVYLIASVELSMGGLVACSMLSARAMAPMSQIAGLLTQYHDAKTALVALDGIVERPIERPVGEHFLSRPSISGDIEFRDVSFSYPHTDLNALRDVNLRIKAGEKIAILGRTGSGKSSLLRLILGLYRPTQGAVLVDGIDLRQLDPGELRRQVGYVPQDIMLFFGSLRENVTLASPQAEDDEIVRAIELGNLTEFVNRHPQGIDLQIGERGESLSGGQRAGVAIARALIGDPPILLLDEPTGAMDHTSEESVKARLREYARDRTVLIVTHRTSLLDIVDRIIVTDNGRIVADGPKESVVEALRQGRIGRGM